MKQRTSFAAGLLAATLALFSIPMNLISQSIPVNGQIYGQPINGVTSSGSSPDFVSTSGEVYADQDYVLGQYFATVYTPPAGKQVLNITYKKTSDYYRANRILLIQLSDGTAVVLYVTKDKDYVGPRVDSVKVWTSPADSCEWKKLIGDAVYAFGTPWSQSSPVLYVTRDNFQSWQIDTNGIGGARIQDIDLDTVQYVYAATDRGLFKQHPDSNAWHPVASFTQATNLSTVFVDRQNRIFVAGSGNGLYVSTDNGSSWAPTPSGLGTNRVNLIADDANHNLYVTASPSIFSAGHIYTSAGGTGSWKIVDTSISRIVGNAGFQTMSVNSMSGDSMMTVGTSYGVFLSTDQGATWTMNNTGIRAENIAGMAKTNSGEILLSTALGIFSNTPPDTSWNKVYPSSGFESSLHLYHDTLGTIYTTDPQILIPSGNGAAAVIKSTDGGTSWLPDTAGLSAVTGGLLFYVDQAGGQHSAGYKYPTANMYVWTKPLNGSWTIDTTGFPTSGSYPVSMTSDGNGYLYVSGTIANDRVMRRPMGGGTWVADTTGIPQSVSYFGNMAAGKNGDMYGVVGYYGPGVMRRSAGTWSNFALPPSVASQYVTGISVDRSGAVFVAFVDNNNVPLGVYFTTDGGTSWTHAGLDSVYVTALVSYGDSTYALSSNAGAFFIGKSGPFTNVLQTTGAPRSFALFQNYPNPFNPSTVISYQLPVNSQVTLRIYDLLGREVQTLVNEKEPAGRYSVAFTASNLSSGIYFYTIRAGNYSAVKKMLLIK